MFANIIHCLISINFIKFPIGSDIFFFLIGLFVNICKLVYINSAFIDNRYVLIFLYLVLVFNLILLIILYGKYKILVNKMNSYDLINLNKIKDTKEELEKTKYYLNNVQKQLILEKHLKKKIY